MYCKVALSGVMENIRITKIMLLIQIVLKVFFLFCFFIDFYFLWYFFKIM